MVTVLSPKPKEYHLAEMRFATEKPDSEGIHPYQFQRDGSINLNPEGIPDCNNVPQWIYGNTLENEFFNAQGFHSADPKKNIVIEGGSTTRTRKCSR